MPTKLIAVLERQKGLIIGKAHSTINKIQEESGAVIRTDIPDKVHLKGDQKQIDKAESMIRYILSEKSNFKKDSLLVKIPQFATGYIIGKQRRSLIDIEVKTDTKIFQEKDRIPHFYIKGDAVNQYKAKLMIKERACNFRRLRGFPLIKKFPFIEDRHVGDDREFTLKLIENPNPHWSGSHYKLISVNEQHLQLEKDIVFSKEGESKDFDELCGQIKDFLQSILQSEDSENLLVDMWCHYGQAYITGVDEAEVEGCYSLQQIKEYLKREDNPWPASFTGGVHQLDVHNFEEELSDNQTVPPYTRCDLSFLSPSCRQIRIKVYLKTSDNGEVSTFCEDGPVVVKNVLEKVSRDNGFVYYLCAPPVHNLKVHIFIPLAHLDCHFMMRTTFRNIVRTPEEEAEDKILIDFLNENLHIKNGKLELPTKQEQLPEDFDLAYWRQSKRRIYSYEGFTIKISEETSENVNDFQTGEDVRTRNDIHVHSKEWDKQFSGCEWQPEHIVQGVPEFLSFVRDVQKLISPEERGEED